MDVNTRNKENTQNISDGCKLILSPFTDVKNKKLGIRLEKNIYRQKEDKIQRKPTGDHIRIEKDGQNNFLTVKVHFAMVMKVMIVIMMMRITMKIMNSSSYLRVLRMIVTTQFHQFSYKNSSTILPSACTVVVHCYLLKM